MTRITTLLSLLIFCACTTTVDPDAVPSKANTQSIDGKNDHFGVDVCELYGWYNDGVCDTFCDEPDPECASECVIDTDCAPVFCIEEPCDANTCNDGECGTSPLTFCESHCNPRGEPNGCETADGCREYCEENQVLWNEQEAASFLTCAERPLCFVTIQQCTEAQSFCQQECQARAEDSCETDESCLSFCEPAWETWAESERRTFTECLTAPLCFRTLEQCFDPAD